MKLTAVSYAIISSLYQSHGQSPAQLQLVFSRDMFSPVSTEVDWNAIQNNKQIKINKSNDRENSKRVPHTYHRGDFITLKKPGILCKLAIPQQGPYKIVRHNNNGSILIKKAPTNIKNVNVQRVAQYYCKTETPITQ